MAMESTAWPSNSECAVRLRTGALVLLLLCGPLFVIFPQIDLAAAAVFFHERGFAGNVAAVEFVRNIFKLVYIGACVIAVAGVVVSLRAREGTFLGLRAIQHLFLISCLAIGPGLVTNLMLKDQWGRARPREVVQFGGAKIFTPALLPARQCTKNCSFVSGEASSMFMVFFAFALVSRRRAQALAGVGLAAGTAAGIIRMAQGGHFMSDVVFSGIFMALTAVMLCRMFALIEARLEGRRI